MKKTVLAAEQKKEKAIIIILSVVALVMLVFCVRAFGSEDTKPSSASQQSTTQKITTVTTVTPPVEATTAQPATKPAEKEKTTAPAKKDEKEEILKVVSDGVNALKAGDASFTGHKVQNIKIELVDSSMPSMNGFVNNIIKAFVKEEVYDYDFTNGVAEDPENGGTSASKSIFPPGDADFTLKKEGVASAKKTKEGENTVYSVVIVAETSTLENPRPPHHNSAADTLDLSTVNIPVATITKADFEYAGATVSVTLNPEGEVVGYYEKLPISGTGEAKALGLSGYGTIEGYLEENWDIKWK